MKKEKKISKDQPDWSWYWRQTLKTPLGNLIWKLASWHHARQYFKLLKRLKIKTVLELGGGSGYLAKILGQKLGVSIALVDNNPKAKKSWGKISGFGEYIVQDFFKFKTKRKWDLVFSDGVLEHFHDPKERVKLLQLHAKFSQKYVVVFVPKKSWFVKKFLHLSEHLGYEKLYTFPELEKEIRQAGLIPLKRASDYHEIGILAKLKLPRKICQNLL